MKALLLTDEQYDRIMDRAGDAEDDDVIAAECIEPIDTWLGMTLSGIAEGQLGRNLTWDEAERLAECLPQSSVPDAIGTILSEALGIQ